MAKKKTAKQKEFDLLLKYADKPDELTKRIKTTDLELMRKYKNQLQWYNIINRKTITDEFIEEFWDKMEPCMPKISVHPNMPLSFLEMNRKYISWSDFVYASGGARFTIDFIKKFEEELKPYYANILAMKNLPEESRDYVAELDGDFRRLSFKADISVKTLEKYKDQLDWEIVSRCARCLVLKKNFEKFEKYINMYSYTSLQYTRDYDRMERVITEEFLLKYKDSGLNWNQIIYCHNYIFNRKVKNKEITTVPLDFFIKHKKELPFNALSEFNAFCTTIKIDDNWYLPWNRK